MVTMIMSELAESRVFTGSRTLSKGDCLDHSAERDTGTLIELANSGGRWSFIHREDHLLAGDEDAAEVAYGCSLAAHLFHHLPTPV